MTILALVVTFNRKKLLKRCIQNIKSQTTKIDELIVINNNSDDGTEQFLKDNNIKHITQKNNGSASGWNTGINYFLKNKFDFIWLMDDDGYPDKNSLNYLKNSFKKNKDIVCASSLVIDELTKINFVFPYPKLNTTGNPIIFSLKRKFNNIKEFNKNNFVDSYPYAQLFNGTLISRDAISQIGNINTNYFIFGEETDYYYRLKETGVVITNINSIQYHPDVSKRKYNNIKIYYYIKNSIINNRKYFNFIILRNFLTLIAIVYRTYKRNGMLFALSLILGKNSKIFYLAIYRGLKNQLRKDYDFN